MIILLWMWIVATQIQGQILHEFLLFTYVCKNFLISLNLEYQYKILNYLFSYLSILNLSLVA